MQRAPRTLWDIPTRIGHWVLVACLPLAWWSAETQNYQLHKWLGYTVIVIVSSRVVWGFVGSRHSRFADFLMGPAGVLAYLRGEGGGSVGHNPLGGWSVIVMLGLLLLQGVSGLFNSDDILFSGPLYYAAEPAFRDAMGLVHEIAFNCLLALVGLHVCAVLYHQVRLREPLVQAMLRGSAGERQGTTAPARLWRYIVVLLVAALLLWAILARAPGPPPMMW